MAGSITALRARVFEFLEGDFRKSRLAWWGRTLLIGLISLNVLAVFLEGSLGVSAGYQPGFWVFEVLSVALFSLEYVLRIWTCVEIPKFAERGPLWGRVSYVFSFLALVDLAAILPFYLGVFYQIDLRQLRSLRLIRIFKLGHYFPSLYLYAKVLKQELPSLGGAVLLMAVLVIATSGLMVAFEKEAQPEVFGNSLQAAWWAVVTLTTVGYGDVTPITAMGKMLGVVVMILGVGTIALPAGLVTGRFMDALKSERERVRQLVDDAARGDGVIDAVEHQKLIEEGHDGGLTRREVDRLIGEERARLSALHECPHCGGSLVGHDGSGASAR